MEDINNFNMHPDCWGCEYGDMERDDLLTWLWKWEVTGIPF